jgi:large-conductance mechanosensitive channel
MTIRSDLKTFLENSNFVTLATAFMIGAQVTLVVTALVTAVVMPFIGIFFKTNVASLEGVTVNDSPLEFGVLAAAVIEFLIVLLVLFFGFVPPYMRYQARKAAKAAAAPRRPSRAPSVFPRSTFAPRDAPSAQRRYRRPCRLARTRRADLATVQRVAHAGFREASFSQSARIASVTGALTAGVAAPGQIPRDAQALAQADDLPLRHPQQRGAHLHRSTRLHPVLRRKPGQSLEGREVGGPTIWIPGVVDRVCPEDDPPELMALRVSQRDREEYGVPRGYVGGRNSPRLNATSRDRSATVREGGVEERAERNVEHRVVADLVAAREGASRPDLSGVALTVEDRQCVDRPVGP